MSGADLIEFHAFLEDLIRKSSNDQSFEPTKLINVIIEQHPERIEKIQGLLNVLGLRALIRNNGRAKRSTTTGPDLFGHYNLGKRLSVPIRDGRGKLRWLSKSRNELTFSDLDSIIARGEEKPAKESKDRKHLVEIEKRTRPYRGLVQSIEEALAMAERDGR